MSKKPIKQGKKKRRDPQSPLFPVVALTSRSDKKSKRGRKGPLKVMRYKPPVKLVVPDTLPDGTRRASNIKKLHTDDAVKLERARQYVLECTLLGYSDYDIGEKLGCSHQRVSQLREEAMEEEIKRRSKLANRVRVMEEIRVLRYMKAWDRAALDTGNARAAEVMLRYMERLHKLLGLDVQKQEISGPGGGPIQNKTIADLTGLTDDELAVMARLLDKAEGKVVEGEVVENSDNKGTDRSLKTVS